MAQIGTGKYTYELIRDFLKLPQGESFGLVSPCRSTGRGGPPPARRSGCACDITRGKDGNFYIAEQEDEGKPAYVCVRDARGAVLARMESRHVHGIGVDSRGDIYAGLTAERSVDKFVRVSSAEVGPVNLIHARRLFL
jgi:hypothetical protein